MVLLAILALAAHAVTPAWGAGKPSYEKRDRAIFDLLDDNHDGVISMPEFKNNQMLIFYLLDRNKDLVLTKNETALPADVFDEIAGPEGKINTIEFLNVVDKAFKNADTNHDSTIDRKEFNALMRRVRE
ncbi:EF-hand domain-containing protein [Azospirillum sp. TSO22-1]|uniref:EF-hand domain-containing protein n=1 Tax=Azospirillum sp. TSO22-1 TaxID=716789 RepID=UPI000D61B1B9|nr:EF-hand domain-containing protein [Azospirillum sp. TSO22-1]PWC52638.1 hypothetical protein TSO221_13475 [Azospirillum sp. TSO22-1]